MRDETTIILNQRTVLEAVQAYLDTHITPKVKLENLQPESSGSGYSSNQQYRCTIKEIVPEAQS